MPLLSELAQVVGGVIVGDNNVEIKRVIGVENLVPGDLTLGATPDALQQALASEATAIIVPLGTGLLSKTTLQVKNPRLAFAQLLSCFVPQRICVPGVHPTAVVGANFRGEGCEVGPLVYIGERVTVGAGTVIEAGAWIGDGVTLGENCRIHGQAVIYADCQIGNKVEIHSGTVIGADGFGYVTVGGEHYKVPQIGIVVIEDEVEIGSNTSIDRATTGETRVKKGSKVDNLVQIGHNCQVGEANLLCGQSALAGSSITGARVTMAGRAALAGHLEVGADSTIGGCAKVISSLPPKSFVLGDPARPHSKNLRIEAAANQLPELLKGFKAMQKEFRKLQEEVADLKNKEK